MSWTDEQWSMFTSIISRGFAARDPFTQDDSRVYRLLLDTVDPDGALQAVRELVLEGQALRPKPGEIVARCRRDPSVPTFEEAYRLIFGPGGILTARPASNGPLTYGSDAERRQLYDQAALTKAGNFHPLVATFVERQGIGHLRTLPVDDPDYGELRRKELRDSWDRHLVAMDGRDAAALAAAGDRSALGMRQFDPLAALGIEKPAEIDAA